MSDFLDSLNPQQRDAVTFADGGALILAGAGTGKTRVLTSRIAWLMTHQHCAPRNILAVTFTNKAAKEMRERIAAMIPFGDRDLALGTFHGVCHRILRRHAAAAGWDKNFQILDSQDQKSFIRRMLSDRDISTDEFPPADCANYINAAKENGIRAANAPASYPNQQNMREIYIAYETACKRENKLDFAELLLSVIDLFSNNQELRQHYAARFRHILIDEFQDTNALQYRWLRLLDAGDNVFFAVGDDDQSIYAFRGANPDNMHNLQRDLRANTLIRLQQNYRSTGNILHAANTLISGNKNRLGKTLITDAGGGALIVPCRAETDMLEAANIADAIKKKIADISPTDIAVLYRTNAQSRLIENAMVERGIPYRIYGGTRFFDRLEIKHALAYLRIAAADDVDALLRVINSPPRGIGKQTLSALSADGDIFAALALSGAPKVAAFRNIVNTLRARRTTDSLPELAHAAIEDSGLLAYYESRPDDRERAENLREFINAAGQFVPDNEDEDPLLAFLSNAALESAGGEGEAGETVNLMTVHAAKGLEFVAVYVAGLEEGMFPTALSLDSFNPAAIEEERRLMYVAVTRARQELFLHYAEKRMVYGQTQTRPPSRFLHELPADALSAAAANNYVAPAIVKRHAIVKAAAAPAAPAEDMTNVPYRPGEVVRHPKYGTGVILRREGRGEELKVDVAFKKVGKKTFLVAAAPLIRGR